MFKKAVWLMVAFVAAALILVIPVWPGTVPASLVPEGARWVVHLDMEKFVATKLYEYLEEDGPFEVRIRDLNRWFKIDAPKDITGLTVFGVGPSDKHAVVAVAGRFDKAHLLTMVGLEEEHKEFSYGAYTIYSTDSDEFGAFVNNGLIVLSESREAVEKVLDTAAGKVKDFTSSELNAALKGVPPGAFLSGVVADLTGLGQEINQSKLVEKASGLFFLAQEKQDILQVRVQVTADSPESAKNMADIAQGLIALGRLNEGQGRAAKFASLVNGLQVKLEGKTIRLEFDGPSREVADLLSHRRGGYGFFD